MTTPPITEPHWPDGCRHDRPRDKYLGTFVLNGYPYDVYVYQDNALNAPKPDMHLCFRYGKDDYQYISPGPATEFVRRFKGAQVIPADYELALPFVERWLKDG